SPPSWAEALVKRGRADNELTRFRYDAILHVGDAAAAVADRGSPEDRCLEIAWDGGALERLEDALRESAGGDAGHGEHARSGRIVLRGVPNSRITPHVGTARAL